MVSKLDNQRRMNMKRNLNKTFAYIWVMTLVMMGGPAFGQRDNGGGNGGNATTQHVEVRGNVYGGGNLAPVAGNTSVLVDQQGCTIGTVSGGVHAGGDVYGGGALADVGTLDGGNTTTVNILDGIINGNVYGGGLGQKQIGDDPETAIAAAVNGVVTVNIGELTGALDEHGFAPSESVRGNATLNGSVFGCNNANGTPKDNVTVNIYKTAHTTGDEGNSVDGTGFAIHEVFGGGNQAHYEPVTDNKKTKVRVWTCDNTIEYVYGGGNAADVGNATTNSADEVVIDGGRIEWVFGGGNGAGNDNPGANIYGNASSTFHGGKVTYFFGGSNEKGTITGSKTVSIPNDGPCTDNYITELYGGNNMADAEGDIVLEMPCSSNPCKIDYLYGGSRNANVGTEDAPANIELTLRGGEYDYVFGGNNMGGTIYGNVTLNLFGGTIHEAAFGGNNAGGFINGKITVNMLEQGTCPLVVHNIYGGGNEAAYSPNFTISPGTVRIVPEVNLIHGTVSKKSDGTGGNVYGGGLGSSATVTANPVVNVGYDASMADLVATLLPSETTLTTASVEVQGNVYGGGQAADVMGSTAVNIQKVSTTGLTAITFVRGDVYGGGALANTNGSNVTLDGGTVSGDLYGGGLGCLAQGDEPAVEALVNGPVQVTVNGGTVTGSVFGCNNINGAPQTTVNVDIYGTDAPAPGEIYALDKVFGGGNMAAYNGTPNVTIHGCNNKIGEVYGGGNAASVSGTDVTVYGGNTIGKVFAGGNGQGVAPEYVMVSGNAVAHIYGGTIDQVFGGNNSSGSITGTASALTINKQPEVVEGSACDMKIREVYGGGNLASGQASTINIGCTGTLVTLEGNQHYGTDQEGIGTVYGGANEADIIGDITLNITSGIVENVFGGNNTRGDISGNITVNIEKNNTATCADDWYVGNVFGGGNLAVYEGTPLVNIKNGTVANVFGGGNGDPNSSTQEPGQVNGTNVTIGDATEGYCANVTGNVYGGGNAAKVNGNTLVTYNDGNALSNVAKLFGGGNQAGATGTATVNMTNGKVTAGVYGGCNSSGAIGGTVTVNVTGGTIGTDATQTANIHGGGYGNSTSTEGNVVVNIGAAPVAPSTTPTGDAVIWGDVYGGSADGSVNSDGSDHTWVTLYGGTINGSLYGGGLGIENDDCNVNGAVKVTVEGGYVKTTTNTSRTTGSVFGCNNAKGSPKSIVEVEINSTAPSSGSGNSKVYALQGVYGGGNLAAYVPTTPSADYPKVTVNGCASSIKDVYGGGNAAPVPNAKVVINGGDISRVFAGGNGESGTPAHIGWNNTDANPSTGDYGTGIATAEIKGGTILQVFGGSNANGVIRVSSSLDINKSTASGACPIKLGEVYGGGNEANGNAGTIAIGCTGDWTTGDGNTHEHHNSTDNRIGYELEGIGTVYGGANKANVNNNIELNITSGIVENVFGGNNSSGDISGSITVNIEKDNDAACAEHWYVGNVYGGGNQAKYQPTTPGAYPAVNIKNGTVSQNVFGGGLGATAKVYSNPVVTVGDLAEGHGDYQAVVLGNVHGGGSAAMVGDGETSAIHNTTVTIQKANSSVAKVFGAGMAAGVTGTTTVNVNNGTVSAGAYGGCDASGEVGGDITVSVTGGTVGTNDANREDGVFGGGYGGFDDLEHPGTSTKGNVTVTISGGDVYGDVYGGSAKGSVNDANSDQTIVTLTSGTIHGDLYGGGLGDTGHPAAVNGEVKVNVNGGTVTNVFGCNNVNGAPQSTVQVNINETTANTMSVTNVYGGGNHADYNGTPDVNIIAGTVSGNVYGGGNDITDGTKGVANSDVEVTGGTVLGGVYGGCNVNGTVTTNSLVKIYGGTIGSQSQLDANTVANVFGGGLGADTKVSGNVEVNIGNATTGPTLYGDVYGGSALGSVNSGSSNTTTVNILNGTLVAKTTNANGFTSYTGGNVFGGGLGEANNTLKGKVNGKVVVNIGAGTPDATSPFTVIVTNLSGNATIGGNVYGCNNSGGSPQDDVTVNIFQTAHTEDNAYGAVTVPGDDISTYAIANVFGGGNEADFSPASTSAKTYVNVYTCVNTIRRVFGGGNAAATPEVVTHIQGGRFFQVFGGGNGERGESFGADVHGNVRLNLHGGNIGEYYGGSNQNGTISGGIFTEVLNDSPCPPVVIEDFFCGGNFVSIYGDLVTTIACSDGRFTNLYGGCNQANIYGNVVLNLEGGTYTNVFGGSKGVANGVSADILAVTDEVHAAHPDLVVGHGGNVTLNLHGGKIENVFGGSNFNGNIEGTITINVLDKENSECPLIITNIYGGSNETNYEPTNASAISPVVNVIHAKNGISGNVYGGSRGVEGAIGDDVTKVVANPLVNIGYESDMTGLPATSAYNPNSYSRKTSIQGSVFGGGDAAKVVGNTEIRLNKGTKVIGNVYGGGNMGEVAGDTKVIVNGKRE